MNSESFIAEIGLAGFNFAPTGWALCNGQLLSISQNTALFSLLGTFYGGDGRTTFALPNLQGAVALHQGQGPGLSDYALGQRGGQESATLTVQQLPVHTHASQAGGQNPALAQAAASQPGTSNNPEDRLPAITEGDMRYAATANASMAPRELTTQPVGGAQPFPVLQPYLVLNYCIALQGVFPPRN